jgi:hypothetical protein
MHTIHLSFVSMARYRCVASLSIALTPALVTSSDRFLLLPQNEDSRRFRLDLHSQYDKQIGWKALGNNDPKLRHGPATNTWPALQFVKGCFHEYKSPPTLAIPGVEAVGAFRGFRGSVPLSGRADRADQGA